MFVKKKKRMRSEQQKGKKERSKILHQSLTLDGNESGELHRPRKMAPAQSELRA